MHHFSDACARNQVPLYQALQPWLEQVNRVLEIGSGSGQHALYFTEKLPHLVWQCSDRAMWLEGLNANIAAYFPANTATALELDVNQLWPEQRFDMLYTANSLHIMSWQSVQNLFAQLPTHLQDNGFFCCYGPFKYRGEFTSPSNANFQQWLIERDSASGIRDFEALAELAEQSQLHLVSDFDMPANNQLLVWQYSA